MTIIDVRCRLTFGDAAEYFRRGMGGRAPSAVREGTIEAFFRELDRARITTAVAVSGNNSGLSIGDQVMPPRRSDNDEQARLQRQYAGRILGVAAIDIGGGLHDPLAELERCVKELGLKAATIEPGREPLLSPNPADDRLYPFYDLAQALGVPVFIQTSGIKGGKNIDYANPRWIDQVAEDFPKLHLICAHGCYPYVRGMIAVALRRTNVWASPDMYTTRLGWSDWVEAVNTGWFAKRFVFGSAFPACGDLRPFLREFRALGWDRRKLDDVMYRNAIEALKLQDDPLFRPVYLQPDVYSRPWPVKQAFDVARSVLKKRRLE